MLVAGILAVAVVAGLAMGAWVFVLGSKDIGQDTQAAANRAADQDPAFSVQTAHLAWKGDQLEIHVIAGPAARSTSVPFSAMMFDMDGILDSPEWAVFRDADGSLQEDPPRINGGDLVEFIAPVDPDNIPNRPAVQVGSSQATLQVPAYIGDGITTLSVLG